MTVMIKNHFLSFTLIFFQRQCHKFGFVDIQHSFKSNTFVKCIFSTVIQEINISSEIKRGDGNGPVINKAARCEK